MSSTELRRLNKLRQVMRLSARGNGIAASIVQTFRGSKLRVEQEMVRSILLGVPLEDSVAPMVSGDDHIQDLTVFLIGQAKINASEASRRADKLAMLFERWVRAKKERLVEQRIMETRSIMVSGILGGVVAMAAALAPLLSSFQLTLTAQPSPPPPSNDFLGILFVVPATFFLGMFFSLRRALLNVAVSSLIYLLVAHFFAPLLVFA